MIPNYSFYVPDDNYKLNKYFKRLQEGKLLSPRLVFIVECHLANNPDPIESEIQFYEAKIKDLKNQKADEGYQDIPEIAKLKKDIISRIKDPKTEARHIRGYLTGPANKKLLGKYGLSPDDFIEMCDRAMKADNNG